ncbi:MAG TPA: hypothetical protein VE870_15230 [Bacteroidales bacterium]|nr:hypothetical protein [Bacteroidales bacterium]
MRQTPVAIFVLLLAFLTGISCNHSTSGCTSGDQLNVLVITGGHDFDTAFFDLFREMDGILYDTVSRVSSH